MIDLLARLAAEEATVIEATLGDLSEHTSIRLQTAQENPGQADYVSEEYGEHNPIVLDMYYQPPHASTTIGTYLWGQQTGRIYGLSVIGCDQTAAYPINDQIYTTRKDALAAAAKDFVRLAAAGPHMTGGFY